MLIVILFYSWSYRWTSKASRVCNRCRPSTTTWLLPTNEPCLPSSAGLLRRRPDYRISESKHMHQRDGLAYLARLRNVQWAYASCHQHRTFYHRINLRTISVFRPGVWLNRVTWPPFRQSNLMVNLDFMRHWEKISPMSRVEMRVEFSRWLNPIWPPAAYLKK